MVATDLTREDLDIMAKTPYFGEPTFLSASALNRDQLGLRRKSLNFDQPHLGRFERA
jgi:hypothetical protein